MARYGSVTAVDGAEVAVTVDPVCMHGDVPGGVARRAVRKAVAHSRLGRTRFA